MTATTATSAAKSTLETSSYFALDEGDQSQLLTLVKTGQREAALAVAAQSMSTINATDARGCTALNYAVRKHDMELIKALCDAGATLDIADGHDNEVVLLAAKQGHLDTLKLLLTYNPEVNFIDGNGLTALHHAVNLRHYHIAVELLDAGAPVDALSPQKETPLHFAARTGDLEMVALLMRREAQTQLQNTQGMVAATVAYMSGWSAVSFLIQQNNPPAAPKDRILSIQVPPRAHDGCKQLVVNGIPSGVSDLQIMEVFSGRSAPVPTNIRDIVDVLAAVHGEDLIRDRRKSNASELAASGELSDDGSSGLPPLSTPQHRRLVLDFATTEDAREAWLKCAFVSIRPGLSLPLVWWSENMAEELRVGVISIHFHAATPFGQYWTPRSLFIHFVRAGEVAAISTHTAQPTPGMASGYTVPTQYVVQVFGTMDSSRCSSVACAQGSPFAGVRTVGGRGHHNIPALPPSQPGVDGSDVSLYVTGLPIEFGEEDLVKTFLSISVPRDRFILPPKRYKTGSLKPRAGFIKFRTVGECERAVRRFNGYVLPGGTQGLSLRWAWSRSESQRVKQSRGQGGPGTAGPAMMDRIIAPRPRGVQDLPSFWSLAVSAKDRVLIISGLQAGADQTATHRMLAELQLSPFLVQPTDSQGRAAILFNTRTDFHDAVLSIWPAGITVGRLVVPAAVEADPSSNVPSHDDVIFEPIPPRVLLSLPLTNEELQRPPVLPVILPLPPIAVPTTYNSGEATAPVGIDTSGVVLQDIPVIPVAMPLPTTPVTTTTGDNVLSLSLEPNVVPIAALSLSGL